MKGLFLSLALVVIGSTVAFPQQAETKAKGNADSHGSATASKHSRNITIQSGTHLAAELQNTIDVRNARVGDRVLLRTTEALKSAGRTVIRKGARLRGHITEVARKTKSNSESRIGILFDNVDDGSLKIPISATIASITDGSANARLNDGDLVRSEAAGESRATATTQSAPPSGGGGLEGGATNTLGRTVNTTSSTASNVLGRTTVAIASSANTTENLSGRSASAASQLLSSIRINNSSGTSAEESSVLSLSGDNLRLGKGTTFSLMISQSVSVGALTQP